MNVVPIGEKVEELDSWEAFWALYPRHEAKKDARKAWDKIDEAKHVEILTSLAAWRPVLAERERNYIPLPASWLRGERWEDELPSEFRRAAHVPFAPETREKKSVMPEHVKAMIAKLRGK